MNLDFNWFLTIPGLFITGGVILLIIALIILLLTNRKSKKEKNPLEENTESTAVPQVTNQAGMEAMAANTEVPPASYVATANGTQPVVDASSVDMNNQVPVVDPATIMAATARTEVAPTVPVVPSPVQSVTTEPTVVDPAVVNSVTASTPTQPQVAINPAIPAANNQPVGVAPSLQPVQPTVNPTNQAVYGGANPAVSNVETTSTPMNTLYGGANPQENPSTLKKVETLEPEKAEKVETLTPETPVQSSQQPQPVVPTVQPVPSVQPQPVVQPQASIQPQPVAPTMHH